MGTRGGNDIQLHTISAAPPLSLLHRRASERFLGEESGCLSEAW